jgi:hypothetical protein
VHEVLCVTSEQCSDVTGVKAKKVGMRVVMAELDRDSRGRPIFHKTRMLNIGALQAKRDRYERLVLLDADTTVLKGFADEVSLVPEAGSFGFCKSPLTKRDLAGVLIVNVDDWIGIGGMDERFEGWGAEDLDMRLRLRFRRHLDYTRINPSTLLSLPHSDALRTELYRTQEKYESLAKNNRIMAENYEKAMRRSLAGDLADDLELQELLGLTDELTQRGAKLTKVVHP